YKKLDSKSDQFNSISKGIIDNAALNKISFCSKYNHLPISRRTMNNISFNSKFNQSYKNYRKTLFYFQSNNDNLFQYEVYKIIEKVSLSIHHNYQFYNHSLPIPNEKHIGLHYRDYSSMDIESLYSQVKLRYCSKQALMINYNDPTSEAIDQSESVAKLKNNCVEIP
ncbi:26360_t:CDS:1, partial [Racocetra persica]